MAPPRRPARRTLAAPLRAWLRGLALLMVIGLAAVVVVAPSLAAATVATAADADVAPDGAGSASETDERLDDDSGDDALLVPAAPAPPRAAHAFAHTRVARVPAARSEPPSLPPPEA